MPKVSQFHNIDPGIEGEEEVKVGNIRARINFAEFQRTVLYWVL